ncbi:hypothetical protein GPALN_014867 [Globodera pallida]|nr:hypothetical protein GPALN_014867 [Globodera pallida]
MAKNAMFYLVILSVILALAFASNEKEAENKSTGIFGKVGRFVTVALAVSSRLGGAGASQGDGAVHGGEKAVANIRSNQLPNNNWMAPPPPMPMKSAEANHLQKPIGMLHVLNTFDALAPTAVAQLVSLLTVAWVEVRCSSVAVDNDAHSDSPDNTAYNIGTEALLKS